MKKIKKKLLISIFVLIIASSVFTAISTSATSQQGLGATSKASKTSTPGFSLQILDAGYGDYDNDSSLDDVFVTFEIYSFTPSVLKLHIYFDLVLPSGYTYNALFYVVTDYSYLKLIIHSFNSATESGWYLVNLDVYRVGGGLGEPGSVQSNYEFDPPTQVGPGQPQFSKLSLVE